MWNSFHYRWRGTPFSCSLTVYSSLLSRSHAADFQDVKSYKHRESEFVFLVSPLLKQSAAETMINRENPEVPLVVFQGKC